MQGEIQKALQRHLDKFSKFRVEFTLTKRDVVAAIEKLFEKDLPLMKNTDENNPIEVFNYRKLYLARLNQIYSQDF